MLRWENTKNAFVGLAEPFSVEMEFTAESVHIRLADLPEGHGDTKLDRAVHAVMDLLNSRAGEVVERKALLDAPGLCG